jgi:hypothetical protein
VKRLEIFEQYEACEERIKFLDKTLKQCTDETYLVLIEAYEKEKEVLKVVLSLIVETIEDVKDPYIRTILHLKYIGEDRAGKKHRLMNWEIANRMNYSEEWVKQKLKKFRKQFKEEV